MIGGSRTKLPDLALPPSPAGASVLCASVRRAGPQGRCRESSPRSQPAPSDDRRRIRKPMSSSSGLRKTSVRLTGRKPISGYSWLDAGLLSSKQILTRWASAFDSLSTPAVSR